MGIMTGSGSLSRVLGPVFVGSIYTRLGTNWTFGITSIMMALAMVWLLVYDSTLVPPSVAQNNGTELRPMGSKGFIEAKRAEANGGLVDEENKLLKAELEAKYNNEKS